MNRMMGRTIKALTTVKTSRQLASSIAQGLAVLFLFVASLTTATANAATTPEAEVRGAVEQAFQQLRSGNYNALYDGLPSATQKRLARERFTAALGRTRDIYELDRIGIEAVRVAGDLAVVDSIIYGRARGPLAGDGKIVARQYLVREGGRWRVTTGDRVSVAPMLAANPGFAKKYPPRQPRVYLRRDGRWVDVSNLLDITKRRALK